MGGALLLKYISEWTYYQYIDDHATWKQANLCCNLEKDSPQKPDEACSYANPANFFGTASFSCDDFSNTITNSIPCCDGSNECIRCQQNLPYEPTKDKEPSNDE